MLFRFDDYVLDTSVFELRFRGELRPLQPKPLDLLHYLVINRDRVVLKHELFSHLWPGVHVTDNALAQAVACVREALDDARSPAILSVPRRGYRFVLDVTEKPPNGTARLGGSLSGHEGGFVIDATQPSELDEALGSIAADGAAVVRTVAHGDAALASFRALMAEYAVTCPGARVGDAPLAAALAGAPDAHALADVVVSFFAQKPSPPPTALVLEHLERADLSTVLLFALLAADKREGLALVGTCAWADLGKDAATARILAPFAFPPLARLAFAPRPRSTGRVARYSSTTQMAVVKEPAKLTPPTARLRVSGR